MNSQAFLIIKDKHHTSLSLEEVSVVLKEIQTLVNDKKIPEIESFLKLLNETSSSVTLLCLLRSTINLRYELPTWETVAQASRAWVKSRGEKENHVILGLY